MIEAQHRILLRLTKVLNGLVDDVLLALALHATELGLGANNVPFCRKLPSTEVAKLPKPSQSSVQALQSKSGAKLLSLLSLLECVLKASRLDVLLLAHELGVSLGPGKSLTNTAKSALLSELGVHCLVGNVRLTLRLLLLNVNHVLHVRGHECLSGKRVGRHVHVAITGACRTKRGTLSTERCGAKLPGNAQVCRIPKRLLLKRGKAGYVILRVLAIRCVWLNARDFRGAALAGLSCEQLFGSCANSSLNLRAQPVRYVSLGNCATSRTTTAAAAHITP